MKRKPRRDVILRRFMAGESMARLETLYWSTRLRMTDIEQIIRDALDGKTKIS